MLWELELFSHIIYLGILLAGTLSLNIYTSD